jgi:hypothetical protein
MELSIVTLIVAVAALLVGIVAGKFIFAKDTKKKVEEADLHAQNLIKEAELRAENLRKEKELAVIEQATTPNQKVHTSSLYNYETNLKNKAFFSPTLVIIGKVVALHRQYGWRSEEGLGVEYFKSGYEAPKEKIDILGLTA